MISKEKKMSRMPVKMGLLVLGALPVFADSLQCPSVGGGAAEDPITGSLFSVGQALVGSTQVGLLRLEAGVMHCYAPLTAEEQLTVVTENLQEIINDNPGTPLADKLADALDSVETALEELDKEPPDNQAAVGNLEGAVGSICDAVLDEGFDAAQGTLLMDNLAGVARQLAVDAINAAIAMGGDPIEIGEAEMFLAEGDAFRALGVAGDCEAFKDAISAYKDALAKAEGAIG